jgi:hypothetical protein
MELKEKIIKNLETLPSNKLEEVNDFIEFIKTKIPSAKTEKKIIKLGGLWDGIHFTEEEINENRKEIWSSLDKEQL